MKPDAFTESHLPDSFRQQGVSSRPGGDELLRKSSLYREHMAQHEEILKHKWIESEKAGYDIGFDRAHVNWLIKHRAGWRRWRSAQTLSALREGVLN